jgi:glucose/arabinose dehydrogenase
MPTSFSPNALRPAAARSLCATTLAAMACACLPASAATLIPGFTETPVASGLSQPTSMAFAPDGRLFVTLQGGALRVIKNDALLPTPFLTLTVDSSGERGLLGVAFDPNFASNQFVYVYYTVPGSPAHNRVSRFTANGDVVQAGSELPLLDLDDLSGATNHNGGSMNFGADGKLYIGVGENANGANSQTLANLLGKLLRINTDGTIPVDNPFFGTATGKNRAIWALGLRNPFTFGIQPGTGRIFIDDVGQNTWEEIDDGLAGANYGWPISEGNMGLVAGQTGPLYTYPHSGGAITGCAITGGAFYNPGAVQFPVAYVGKYFFSDLCGGWIRVFDPVSVSVADFATGISSPVKQQVGPTGSLYYLYGAGGTGGVNRVDATTAFGVTGAASRKVHGSAGTFDLPLSLVTTNPSTEPRTGGAGGSHTIVITFNHPPISGAVAITEGAAVAGGPTFSGNDMIVPLNGVANAQYVTVMVSSVNSSDGFSGGTGSVRFGVLRGDVNGSRAVTIADLGIVNAQLAKPVTAANYLDDISLSGTLTVADKGMANAMLTTSLPAP